MVNKNVRKVFELQLYKMFKKLENTEEKIDYNLLFNLINSNIIDLKYISLEERLDNSVLLKKLLIDLLDKCPDFINCNKTLSNMTESFIKICKKKNYNKDEINDENINNNIISYLENSL